MSTMNRKAIEAGFEFERDWERLTLARRLPGSGNQWHSPMDHHQAGTIVWSLKCTTGRSISVSDELLDEVIDAARGMGGRGAGVLAGLALRIGGPEYDCVVLPREDFFTITREKPALVRASKAEARREGANIPIIFREDT